MKKAFFIWALFVSKHVLLANVINKTARSLLCQFNLIKKKQKDRERDAE